MSIFGYYFEDAIVTKQLLPIYRNANLKRAFTDLVIISMTYPHPQALNSHHKVASTCPLPFSRQIQHYIPNR